MHALNMVSSSLFFSPTLLGFNRSYMLLSDGPSVSLGSLQKGFAARGERAEEEWKKACQPDFVDNERFAVVAGNLAIPSCALPAQLGAISVPSCAGGHFCQRKLCQTLTARRATADLLTPLRQRTLRHGAQVHG